MSKARIIFHIDMNCYFVSCELAARSELNGKPVAVAPRGSSRKGIILTASYEARKYGVNSAMLVQEALKKCPQLVLLDPHYELYEEYSHKFMNFLKSISPLIEPASIDEAYLDVTDVCEPDKILSLANHIQRFLMEQYKLPCSIGIGPNKFLAKIGSDYKKPLGITVMRKREVETVLWPLPVSAILGVGKKTAKTFEFLKIKTIGELANYKDKQILIDLFGKTNYEWLMSATRGEGDNVVDPNRYNEISSISLSQTFDVDLFDPKIMLDYLKLMTNSLEMRLEEKEYYTQTITIQIRYNDFRTITRSKTIYSPIRDSKEIFIVVKSLFEDFYDPRIPVRLLGIHLSKFTKGKETQKQMSIFDDLTKEEKDLNIDKLLKSINKTYGEGSIKIGVKNK